MTSKMLQSGERSITVLNGTCVRSDVDTSRRAASKPDLSASTPSETPILGSDSTLNTTHFGSLYSVPFHSEVRRFPNEYCIVEISKAKILHLEVEMLAGCKVSSLICPMRGRDKIDICLTPKDPQIASDS